MDYFVWSVVGSKANEHRVASRDTPKHQITEVTDSIDKEGVARACACFRTRINPAFAGVLRHPRLAGEGR